MVFHGDFPAISADFPWSDCLTGELESGWWRGARPRQRRLALVRRSGERRRATLGARAPGFGDARVLRGFRHGKCPIYRWFTWVYLLKMVIFHKKSGDFTDFTQKSGVFFRQKTIWEFQLTPFNFGMKSLRKWDFFAKLKKFHQCF